ncbi:lysophospholipase [Acidobacteria bacterium AH-259-D05]|nr:lysophospholipase [Acidobacteria bacterium AH-259-D05]
MVARKTTILLFLAVVLLLVLLGGGWFFSDLVKEAALRPRLDDLRPQLEVVALEEDRITLRLTGPSNDDWTKDGIWGLRWDGGYGQVGRILKIDDQQVVREFFPLMGNLKTGDMVGLYIFAFPDDPDKAFGLLTQKVFYSSPLGQFPAWFIDGSHSTWFILVHGKRDAPPREALRSCPILSTVAEVGLPALLISYRNDVAAPASPDGFHRYGQTEWQDLQGAVDYAIEHGAEQLVLMGYSMGGGIIMNFLYQSALADKVVGIILDAPMLNLGATIDFQAVQLGVPRPFITMGKFISGLRFNINWQDLNYLSRANELTMPLLLFHGDADTTVPIEASDALVSRWSGGLTYAPIRGATHIRSWNLNPDLYEKEVRRFLKDLIQ